MNNNHKCDIKTAADVQREYYARTAKSYDQLHEQVDEEHNLALTVLSAYVDYFDVESILDIGSGTGRALRFLKMNKPSLVLRGIEPVAQLRHVGIESGLTSEELIDGDATSLDFNDDSFDFVCAFGVLHHVAQPNVVISEMLRVARVGIFISDSNNFGQGSFFQRCMKQFLDFFGCWPLADRIRTRGTGYMISENDGLFYSYSVFNNYGLVKRSCKNVYVLNTKGTGINPYRTASHIALLGIK